MEHRSRCQGHMCEASDLNDVGALDAEGVVQDSFSTGCPAR